MQEYKVFTGVNLPISLLERIKDFQKRYGIKEKTEAVQQLLNTALFIESKLGLVDSISSEELGNIKEQLETGQLVDYFAHMNQQKFSILINILKDEEKIRNKKK
jgi:hypothetical protein